MINVKPLFLLLIVSSMSIFAFFPDSDQVNSGITQEILEDFLPNSVDTLPVQHKPLVLFQQPQCIGRDFAKGIVEHIEMV